MKRRRTSWWDVLLPALGVLAYGWAMAVACSFVPEPAQDGAALLDPPPAHPERLAAHVPPTAVERALWAQLAPDPA